MRLTVGAVVPNYNCGRYLAERLTSIAIQTRPIQRLVFLDDASTDNSWAVAEPFLATSGWDVEVHRNTHNSGSVLHQWQQGALLLDTDLVWIAEADDSADHGLIENLAACLDQDPEASFVFCDSIAIGPAGERLTHDGKAYAAALNDQGLSQDGAFPHNQFLARFLSPRNLVVSASAVLWRRSALLAALAAIRHEAPLWRCAGDWRVYAEACSVPGQVHYLAAPLNLHRRHPASVTGSTPPAKHFAEVVAMLAMLRRRIGASVEQDAVIRRHLATLRRHWGLYNPAGEG